MTRATAVAHPNIALVKYWGKTDRELNLPATGSLSLTLDIFPTTTTVEVTDDPLDRVVLDGVELSGEESSRVRTVLERGRFRGAREGFERRVRAFAERCGAFAPRAPRLRIGMPLNFRRARALE